jgi:putative spermidine/putrescine transport system permease protein
MAQVAAAPERARAGPASRPRRDWTPWFLLLPNAAWLGLFMAGSLVTLFVISLRGYQPGVGILPTIQLGHYVEFLSDSYYRAALWRSLSMATQVTLWCLVLGFPLAYALSRLRGFARAALYIAILLPLLTSQVVRTFGWMILLSNSGFINRTLIDLGLIASPIPMMYRMSGIIIALVEVLLPFMVLALDAALLNIDPHLYEAARNLGARSARIFLQITLPLSLPGIVSGSVLVFALAISAFVTPSLIGGPRVEVMATLIYQQGISLMNWPFGAAIAFIMLFAMVAILTTVFGLANRTAAAEASR